MSQGHVLSLVQSIVRIITPQRVHSLVTPGPGLTLQLLLLERLFEFCRIPFIKLITYPDANVYNQVRERHSNVIPGSDGIFRLIIQHLFYVDPN